MEEFLDFEDDYEPAPRIENARLPSDLDEDDHDEA